jgi:hypothetical protein
MDYRFLGASIIPGGNSRAEGTPNATILSRSIRGLAANAMLERDDVHLIEQHAHTE